MSKEKLRSLWSLRVAEFKTSGMGDADAKISRRDCQSSPTQGVKWHRHMQFCDPMLTAATVDRMTHKSHIIDTNGSSYRLRQRLAQTNAVGGPLTVQAE